MASFEDLDEKQRLSLSRAMHDLLNADPSVALEAKRLLMKANPKVKFAEVQAVDQTQEAIGAQNKQISELEAKLLEERTERLLEKRRAEARAKGLDPEAVEKLIVDYKLGDWDKALELAERMQQIAPATPAAGYESATKMPDTKELWNDPDGWARQQAHQAIDEMRGRVKAH